MKQSYALSPPRLGIMRAVSAALAHVIPKDRDHTPDWLKTRTRTREEALTVYHAAEAKRLRRNEKRLRDMDRQLKGEARAFMVLTHTRQRRGLSPVMTEPYGATASGDLYGNAVK